MEEDYYTKHIITYMGNKRKFVGKIKEIIELVKNEIGEKNINIAEGFSGSGVLSRVFKDSVMGDYSQPLKNFYVNDLSGYSKTLNQCYLTSSEDFTPDILEELCYHLKRINNFLSNEDYQYFYIKSTDTFIEYNGIDYKIIPEDNLWFTILNDITEKKTLLECKQKIKTKIINYIKNKSLFQSIPESHTIQNMINFFTPILFSNKEKVKYFFAIVGDNILNKSNQNNYFVQDKSKEFFEIIENLSGYYFEKKINIIKNFKFKYRGQAYNTSRLIYFNNNIKNKSVWFSFIKENFLNFIVLCSHYSTRYINAENYASHRQLNFKNDIFYLKYNTKNQIIDTFLSKFIFSETNSKIHSTDMQFLWSLFLKEKNIENIIYKVELENILRDKLEYNSAYYMNINSKLLSNIIIFKDFFSKDIEYDDDDELEISEIYKIMQTKNQKLY